MGSGSGAKRRALSAARSKGPGTTERSKGTTRFKYNNQGILASEEWVPDVDECLETDANSASGSEVLTVENDQLSKVAF
jgi:hypothetical protein